MKNYVLIGGGLTSGKAALTLLKAGVTDLITIITDEPYLPYERPGLSKGYLLNKENEDSLYTDNKTLLEAENLTVIKNTHVTRINRTDKTVTLSTKQVLPYSHLLIATGAKPRTLAINGNNRLPIYYLRTIDDANQIKDQVANGLKKAVVIGASFIGMEVASSLTQLGVDVTVIHKGKTVFDKLESKQLSEKFITYFKNKGVAFLLSDEIERVDGNLVITKSKKTIPADFIVAGIGVLPQTDLADQAGLTIDNGVVVNEFLKTEDEAIWAAGDIANFPDFYSQKRRRIEHWDNANTQGTYIAKQWLGSELPFKHLSYFFSDIFDLSFEFFGDSSLASRTHVIDQWDNSDERFITLYINVADRLVGAFIMGVGDDVRSKIIKAIEEKTEVNEAFLHSID